MVLLIPHAPAINPRLILAAMIIFSRWFIWSFHRKTHGKMAKKKSAMTQRTVQSVRKESFISRREDVLHKVNDTGVVLM